MHDSRSPVTPRALLVCGAPVAGLLAGAALWLIVGGPGAPGRELDALAKRNAPVALPAAGGEPTDAALSTLAGRPLLTEGSINLPRITLAGVSRLPGRAAALVALGGSEPGWIQVGETVEGLTLVSVHSDSVLFDSINGPITLLLGEMIDGATASAPPTDGARPDDLPAGVKLPPEPKGAPRP